MAKKRHYESAGRRHNEMSAAGMLHENRSEVANMPQDVKYHPWGRPNYGSLDSNLDDTIAGINNQMSKDESQGKKFMRPHKY